MSSTQGRAWPSPTSSQKERLPKPLRMAPWENQKTTFSGQLSISRPLVWPADSCPSCPINIMVIFCCHSPLSSTHFFSTLPTTSQFLPLLVLSLTLHTSTLELALGMSNTARSPHPVSCFRFPLHIRSFLSHCEWAFPCEKKMLSLGSSELTFSQLGSPRGRNINFKIPEKHSDWPGLSHVSSSWTNP